MSSGSCFPFFSALLVLLVINNVAVCGQRDGQLEVVEMAHSRMLRAMQWARGGLKTLHGGTGSDRGFDNNKIITLEDCLKLYGDSEPRVATILLSSSSGGGKNLSHEDAVTWLSAALASHHSCLSGLEEKRLPFFINTRETHQNLTLLLKEALASYGHKRNKGVKKKPTGSSQPGGLLASWNLATSKPDLTVAQDGSGDFKSIKEAVAALSRMGRNRPNRAIVHVKSGVYHEKVEIGRDLKYVMFVGDGMDRTIVTGNHNVQDGSTTFSSATFGVSGDGFWARDMTFENTAGPEKHQAVALRVSSDLSVFYRCSFRGYQDTLLVHSLRQFYRDCHIYGTVDFIFGDAAAVFQNCDILVRRPMGHQSNLITAQGRDDRNENTGISIIHSRVAPAPDFAAVKGEFKNYLGRPWKKYSRTVFIKTDLDGMVDPKGWEEWSGDFAISTLYYGEFENTGAGANTGDRVKWPGFHVLRDSREASPFTVKNFIQGDVWIPDSGVPFSADI